MNIFKILPALPGLIFALMIPAVHAGPTLNARQLYQNNCAACHGANMEGASAPTLGQHNWLHGAPTAANLRKVIAQGVPEKGMPSWSAILSTQQIGLLADYIAGHAKTTAAAPVLTSWAKVAPATGQPVAQVTPIPDLAGFKLPAGFHINVYANGLPAARAMAVSSSGIVYVGSRAAGKVYAMVPNADKITAKVVVIAEGLDAPIGLTLLNGALYVAEIGRIIRFDDIDKRYMTKPSFAVVKADIPNDKWHGEKVIKAGPDGKLYMPVGAPCNVCETEDKPHAKIWRMNPDGSQFEEYARGIRNTVGFAFHPKTNALWFTDNGRDNLGDNSPSCELNVAPKPGLHFGFPYCHGGVVPDPELSGGRSCDEFEAPVAKLGPHVAPLGLSFYNATQFPEAYQGNLFVAEHGSWNRSKKIGYRVELITLYDNKMVSDTPFLDGFIRGEQVVGRPVDIAVIADGSVLISDDYGGRVYRVSYDGK
ncbi:PQQ-dependent sugar dehydrogenase [Oxalobacteraceae bacterium OTU3CINTB1]|nr:PQQ-dependent sugar dehydrogenase [Oxalobacteraceae bacterium OTU3CINTB1]